MNSPMEKVVADAAASILDAVATRSCGDCYLGST